MTALETFYETVKIKTASNMCSERKNRRSNEKVVLFSFQKKPGPNGPAFFLMFDGSN